MKRIFNLLARLASLSYQKKYIIDGTKDEYVLPDQLLNEVISHINTTLSNPKLSGNFKEKQLAEFVILLRDLKYLSSYIPFEDEFISNEDLILRNQYWITARNLASEFLENNGFVLTNWEEDTCN